MIAHHTIKVIRITLIFMMITILVITIMIKTGIGVMTATTDRRVATTGDRITDVDVGDPQEMAIKRTAAEEMIDLHLGAEPADHLLLQIILITGGATASKPRGQHFIMAKLVGLII